MSWVKEGTVVKVKLEPLIDPFSSFDLIREINNKLVMENEVPPFNSNETMRVSSIVKLCPREEALRHKHGLAKIEKIEARLKRTFDFGRAFHTLVQNEWLGPWGLLWGNWICVACGTSHEYCTYPTCCTRCGNKKFLYEELSFFNEEYGITAHPDGIMVTPNGNIILELKTVNARQYKLVSDMRRSPLEQHIFQINMYMWLSGLKDGLILYFDKDESMLCQFNISYNELIVDMLLQRVKKTRQCILDNVVPEEKICEKSDCTRAKTCVVRKYCFSK